MYFIGLSLFGIKVDATPGRLSQAALFIKREGWSM
jgi:hypothetical protein